MTFSTSLPFTVRITESLMCRKFQAHRNKGGTRARVHPIFRAIIIEIEVVPTQYLSFIQCVPTQYLIPSYGPVQQPCMYPESFERRYSSQTLVWANSILTRYDHRNRHCHWLVYCCSSCCLTAAIPVKSPSRFLCLVSISFSLFLFGLRGIRG